jgi:hypothetical protein
VLFWADPNVAVTPLAELAELLDFWVVMPLVVFDRKA